MKEKVKRLYANLKEDFTTQTKLHYAVTALYVLTTFILLWPIRDANAPAVSISELINTAWAVFVLPVFISLAIMYVILAISNKINSYNKTPDGMVKDKIFICDAFEDAPILMIGITALAEFNLWFSIFSVAFNNLYEPEGFWSAVVWFVTVIALSLIVMAVLTGIVVVFLVVVCEKSDRNRNFYEHTK